MPRFRAYLDGRTGWRRFAAAFLLGCCLTLTMAPVGFFPAALVAVSGFIWLAQGARNKKQSFLTGWAFGCGYFITGLYWISAALFVDIALWGWVLPLSLVAGPALLALATYAFIPLLAHRWRHAPVLHAIVFCTGWAAIEWLRGHLFTGFPWNLPGYMWQFVLPVMQLSSVIGIYGLTLMTLLWAALPVLRENRRAAAAVLASFVLAAVWGGARLWLNPTMTTDAPLVRIVQANIPQTAKWDRDTERRNIEKHALLSDPAAPADVVIWPETALTSDPLMAPAIGAIAASGLPAGSFGIMGSLRVSADADAPDRPRFHNSVYLVDSAQQVLGHYDKFHLVPFGEYIPYREQLNLTPIAAGISNIGDFTAGPGPQTLAGNARVPPFSPLICYEVIFPRAVTTPQGPRPQWLVNVTNDGWYGRSSGPYQHLEIARVRAIEEGLPLARAANTGISVMTDPLGRVTARLDLGESGAITTPLPHPLPPTLYSRYGDIPFGLMLAALPVLAFWRHGRRRHQV